MFQYHINLRFISFERVLVISFLNIILKNRLHVYNRFRFTSNPSDIQFISNARYICVQRNMRYAFFVVLLWTVQCDQLKYIQLSSSRIDYLNNNNTSTYVVYLCRSMLTRKKPRFGGFLYWFHYALSLLTDSSLLMSIYTIIITFFDDFVPGEAMFDNPYSGKSSTLARNWERKHLEAVFSTKDE